MKDQDAKTYTVAVFPYRSYRKTQCNAYLRDYNPSWEGCNLVDVKADSGKEAKRQAIEIVRHRIEFGTEEERRSVKWAL